jgi:hypothetical protein
MKEGARRTKRCRRIDVDPFDLRRHRYILKRLDYPSAQPLYEHLEPVPSLAVLFRYSLHAHRASLNTRRCFLRPDSALDYARNVQLVITNEAISQPSLLPAHTPPNSSTRSLSTFLRRRPIPAFPPQRSSPSPKTSTLTSPPLTPPSYHPLTSLELSPLRLAQTCTRFPSPGSTTRPRRATSPFDLRPKPTLARTSAWGDGGR